METYYTRFDNKRIVEILMPKDIQRSFKTKGSYFYYDSESGYYTHEEMIFFVELTDKNLVIAGVTKNGKFKSLTLTKITNNEYEIVKGRCKSVLRRIDDFTKEPSEIDIREIIKREVNECYFAAGGPGARQCESHFLANS